MPAARRQEQTLNSMIVLQATKLLFLLRIYYDVEIILVRYGILFRSLWTVVSFQVERAATWPGSLPRPSQDQFPKGSAAPC